jgi:hypothetical protein
MNELIGATHVYRFNKKKEKSLNNPFFLSRKMGLNEFRFRVSKPDSIAKNITITILGGG